MIAGCRDEAFKRARAMTRWTRVNTMLETQSALQLGEAADDDLDWYRKILANIPAENLTTWFSWRGSKTGRVHRLDSGTGLG